MRPIQCTCRPTCHAACSLRNGGRRNSKIVERHFLAKINGRRSVAVVERGKLAAGTGQVDVVERFARSTKPVGNLPFGRLCRAARPISLATIMPTARQREFVAQFNLFRIGQRGAGRHVPGKRQIEFPLRLRQPAPAIVRKTGVPLIPNSTGFRCIR